MKQAILTAHTARIQQGTSTDTALATYTYSIGTGSDDHCSSMFGPRGIIELWHFAAYNMYAAKCRRSFVTRALATTPFEG